MFSTVSTRYARAFADILLGGSSGVAEPYEALEQLRRFSTLLKQQREVRVVMLSPAVSGSAKKGVIRSLSQPLGLAPIVRDFLYVVVDHQRLAHLGEVSDALESELDGRTGALKAEVRTARPLAETQQRNLRDQLSRITRKNVRATFATQEELLGGAVVQIGSTIYDGSVRGQLEALRRKLAEA